MKKPKFRKPPTMVGERGTPAEEIRRLARNEGWLWGMTHMEYLERIRKHPEWIGMGILDFDRGCLIARKGSVRSIGVRLPHLRPIMAESIRDGRRYARRERKP